MKKFLLLPVLVFFAACSTDDSDLGLTQEDVFTTGSEYRMGVLNPACLEAVSASVIIDLSQGINNPKAVFTGTMAGVTANINYRARIEVQNLSDCENINSGSGNVTVFSMSGNVQNPSINSPVITVDGDLLPALPCYRWRMLVEGVSTTKSKGSCTIASEWYDAPLF